MAGSAISTPTYQAVNANIANDGSADSPRGYAISTNADLAMTIANTRVYATATSANRIVTLPTTSVKAGMVVEVATACTSPYTIAINSSGANLIDTLKGTKGKISLMALVNTPVAAADWCVMDVYDEGTWNPSVTATSGTITSHVSSGTHVRIGRQVTLNFLINITDNGTGSGVMTIAVLPFTSNATACGIGRESGTTGKSLSMQLLENDATIWCWAYDNSYPVATGSYIRASVVYQI